ncbi:MAG: hypothetical protein ACHREM_31940, partial [Polyangiales bacterium]
MLGEARRLSHGALEAGTSLHREYAADMRRLVRRLDSKAEGVWQIHALCDRIDPAGAMAATDAAASPVDDRPIPATPRPAPAFDVDAATAKLQATRDEFAA